MSATSTITSTEPPSSLTLNGLRSTRGSFTYLDRSVTQPYSYTYEREDKGAQTNFKPDTIEADVHDLSSLSAEQRLKLGFNLDEAGFALIDGWGDASTAQRWAEQTWDDPNAFIEDVYYKDVEALIKKHLGATEVHIFDHTVRKRNEQTTGPSEATPSDPNARQPISFVHVDQNRWAGENRIRKHVGQETLDRVLKGELHAQLVNVWRPLRGQAQDWPLAYVDSRSAQPEDWITGELRYKDWTGQTMSVYSNPSHKWYYHRALPTDKAVMLKCYDSATETRVAHSAFKNSQTPANALPRWSVEVRSVVITDPKTQQ